MLKIVTGGESHGKGLIAVIEGLPSNLKIDIDFINQELARRQEGFGRGKRMCIEKDKAEILSGLRDGVTLGSPLTIFVKNRDNSLDRGGLTALLSPRPGHADLAGIMKYNFRDCRNVWERASARSTVSIVACGAIAKMLLHNFRITIVSHVISIGKVEVSVPAGISYAGISYEELFLKVEQSPLRVYQKNAEKAMIKEIEKAGKRGDTLGGVFEVVGLEIPAGLGSYTASSLRLDGRIACAFMNIPSVKAVEIGAGLTASKLPGSSVHDEISYDRTKKIFFRNTNRAGGIEGGMSNGEPIVARAAMKPISTLKKPIASVDIRTKKRTSAQVVRGDICVVPAGGIIGEAAMAVEIASCMRQKFGGDSLEEMKRNYRGYISQLKRL